MKVYKDHQMKEYSNMKVGGVAKEYIIVDTREELLEVLKTRDKTFILGNGTNTLFTDDYMDMTFISLKNLKKVEDLGDGYIRAESGIDFGDFIDYLASNNLGGLEDLAGIPGSLGGLVYMNGGAYGTEIFDWIDKVEIVDDKKNLKELAKADIEFSYRTTEIQSKKWVVVSTTFKLKAGFSKERVEELKAKRENNHPLDKPNLGSTFKNPAGEYSACLIIEAGMQGHKIGGATVSGVHPNFIENDGSATAKDVKDLIQKVKVEVHKKTGFELKEEIVKVGEN